MPDPLLITFPGRVFEAQMTSTQKILADKVRRQEHLPISLLMEYINLSDSNVGLERKLNARGNLIPYGQIYTNNAPRALHERLYDTGEQLKEVWLQFPKNISIRVSEPTDGALELDFTVGEKIICIAKGLPDSTGLGESFIVQTLRFNRGGTRTKLKEEFGEGEIHIIVDYSVEIGSPLKIKYAGKSFRSKFFNTLASSFSDDPCCQKPPVQVPRRGRAVVPLHFRILYPPRVSVQNQVSAANDWLKRYKLELQIKSIKELHLPQFEVLDLTLPGTTETCIMQRTSVEQDDLYINHRDSVPRNEIMIFYVLATTPSYGGCASHPVNFPGGVVVASTVDATLPHEICHILGLNHVNDNYRLMTGNGTYQILSPPPDLVDKELDIIWKSPYVRIT